MGRSGSSPATETRRGSGRTVSTWPPFLTGNEVRGPWKPKRAEFTVAPGAPGRLRNPSLVVRRISGSRIFAFGRPPLRVVQRRRHRGQACSRPAGRFAGTPARVAGPNAHNPCLRSTEPGTSRITNGRQNENRKRDRADPAPAPRPNLRLGERPGRHSSPSRPHAVEGLPRSVARGSAGLDRGWRRCPLLPVSPNGKENRPSSRHEVGRTAPLQLTRGPRWARRARSSEGSGHFSRNVRLVTRRSLAAPRLEQLPTSGCSIHSPLKKVLAVSNIRPRTSRRGLQDRGVVAVR